jgi:hypothetical protein
MNNTNTRITCSLHYSFRDNMQKILTGIPSIKVFFESCRAVRNQEKKKFLSMGGNKIIRVDWPGDRYYITADSETAVKLSAEIFNKIGLDVPGHGSMIMQDVSVYAGASTDAADKTKSRKHQMAQITAILSLPKAGDQLAAAALDYGIGVPVISLGEGTGLRDSLGLLRITIPPQKEIVHLIVSSYDSENMLKLLIEHGYIDRPGGGFIYSTQVVSANLDSKMVIGRQTHSASMDQMIAAIDELKGDPGWRKRSMDGKTGKVRFIRKQQEITVYCPEGSAESVAACAIDAGAKGATFSRVQSLTISDSDRKTSALERVVVLVPEKIAESIAEKVFSFGMNHPGQVLTIESQEVKAAFSHS